MDLIEHTKKILFESMSFASVAYQQDLNRFAMLTGASGDINGNNPGRASYSREINSVSYTKSDDTLHLLCPSVLIIGENILDADDETQDISFNQHRTQNNTFTNIIDSTIIRIDENRFNTLVGTMEFVDRGALVNDKISSEDWGNSRFYYSSQNPRDAQENFNVRAKYRIPLSMKIYPKAFVWRYLANGNPIALVPDISTEFEHKMWRGGIFTDLSQNCNA